MFGLEFFTNLNKFIFGKLGNFLFPYPIRNDPYRNSDLLSRYRFIFDFHYSRVSCSDNYNMLS